MTTWEIHKHQIESPHGIVAAQHHEAAAAGAHVLKEGANAMDAAIVGALVLSIVEPWLSGIGGGGFLLHADGRTGEVDTLDFNLRAPRNLDPGRYALAGGDGGDWFNWPSIEDDRNLIGFESICVPGAVAGFNEALARYGSLDWADAVAPAIAVAERGMRLDWFSELCFAIDAKALSTNQASTALFLDPGARTRDATGRAVYLPMPAKAAFLKTLAERGARDMYEGDTARTIVHDLQAGGSVIDYEDLCGYQPLWAPSQSIEYGGHQLHSIARLSGGASLVHTMHHLRRFLPRQARPDATAASEYAKAIRSAYEVRLNTMGHAGAAGGDCTSHISVVDRNGNMVALTNTLLSRFGSKVTLPSIGTLMNNGMMWFDPRPGTPNSIAAGAQPLANMCPVILTRHGRPTLSIGAAGGRQIFPAIAQLLSYVLDFGMSLEEAFNAPRIDASMPTVLVDRVAGSDVAAKINEAYPVEIVANTLHPVQFGIPSAVMADPDRKMNIGMAHPNNPWAKAVSEACDEQG